MRENKFSIFVGLLLLAALALGACSGIASAQAQTPAAPAAEQAESPRTITVTGSGQAALTPDIAYVTIGVRTEGQDAAEAVAENSEKSQTVIQAIREAGVAARDIRTTNFSIYPQQSFNNEGQPQEITYVVENSVYVTVRELDLIGSLLDEAVQAGANSIHGIQFDVADKAQALSGARREAIDNARAVAEEVAEAAGVEIGEVRSIDVYGGSTPVPYFAARTSVAEVAMDVPVSTGEMILTVDVQVVYAIR